MTEAAHQMTSAPLPPKKRKPGTVGIPHGGVKVRVVDANGKDAAEGEVAIKGDNVTKGYLNNVSLYDEVYHRTDLDFFVACRRRPTRSLTPPTAGSEQATRASLTKTVT